MITYPTNRLLGVVDRPADAQAAADALAGIGVPRDAVTLLAGDEGRDRLARLGAAPTPLSRIVRLFQFVLMDQTPDFLVYERAIVDGRTVMAVHAADRDGMLAAATVLERHGGHFLNWFGRLMTEEVSLWRGEEPPIPDALRR